MGKIISINNISIEESLAKTTRQYLCGDLKKPQLLSFVKDKRLEIGITEYKDSHVELPHWHSEATEFQLILEGYTQYLDCDTNEVFSFSKGDFYAIFPKTKYAQKSISGTKILFIKVPSINDKNIVNVTNEIETWLSIDPFAQIKLNCKAPIGFSGERAIHSLSVAKMMQQEAEKMKWRQDKCSEMFVLGLLHDSGYEFVDDQSKHAYAGGLILLKSGYKYWKEVYFHGFVQDEYHSTELDLLNKADILTNSRGEYVSAFERLRDIAERYSTESSQYLDAKKLSESLGLLDAN